MKKKNLKLIKKKILPEKIIDNNPNKNNINLRVNVNKEKLRTLEKFKKLRKQPPIRKRRRYNQTSTTYYTREKLVHLLDRNIHCNGCSYKKNNIATNYKNYSNHTKRRKKNIQMILFNT